MHINNNEGKEIFYIDDLTLIIVLCIFAFMVVGHC